MVGTLCTKGLHDSMSPYDNAQLKKKELFENNRCLVCGNNTLLVHCVDESSSYDSAHLKIKKGIRGV